MASESDILPPDGGFFAFRPEVRRSIRASDRFLVSYPRSGNTWMRCVLAASHLLEAGGDAMSAPDIYPVLDASIPDVHKGPLPDAPVVGREPGWRLIKSHNLREVRGHQMGYLFRKPEVALVSYAHYAGRAAQGADRFVLRQVRTWAAEGELALTMDSGTTCFVAYEDLITDPGIWVARLAAHLDLEFSPTTIARALEVMNFQRMKAAERSGHRVERTPGGAFFRRGKENLESGDLQASTLEKVKEWASPVYERLLARARES